MNIERHLAAIPTQTAQERDGIRANANRLLSSGTGAQKDAAKSLLAALDAFESEQSKALEERLMSMPVARRVVEAFTRRPFTDNERRVIQTLLDHPGSTTTELTRYAGLGESMIWQMHFGNLCKAREDLLWPAKGAETRDGPFWCGILADAERGTNRFTMKPDVAAAFVELGLKAKQ